MFKFFLYKIGQFFVNNFSLDLSYKLAVLLSDLQFLFSPRDRRAVCNNLRQITGRDDGINQLAREVFRNFGKYLVEFFRTEKMVNAAYVSEKIKIDNVNHIDDVLKNGKGGIVLTAHLGNWELGGVTLSLLGYPIVAIALPHKERPVNDLFNHQRQIKGVTVIPTNVAIRRCIDTLRNNGLVALLADRDFSEHGEIMDFLGRKVMIPKGAAAFSLKMNAPIIPSFLIRQSDNSFVLSIEEPIYPPEAANFPKATEKELLEKVMKEYLVIIERYIKQYPTQWLMFREFGKEHQRELEYQKLAEIKAKQHA